MTPEPLEVELLLEADKRRVSIEEHAAFQSSLRGPAQSRKEREASRLLNLLDEIGRDGAE